MEIRIARFISIIMLLIVSASMLESVASNNSSTNVTGSMVRKIKYIYDTDEVFRRTFNEWYGCSSWEESYEKMDDIMKNPNLAKPIIYRLFNRWGTGETGYIYITRNYGFTDDEYNIALDIYDEKYHFRQREAEKEAQRKQEEILRQQKHQQDVVAETAKLKEWEQHGSDYFTEFPRDNGVLPLLDINLDNVIDRYDMSGYAPSLSRISDSRVVLEILQDKTIRNIVTSGNLAGMFIANDISVIEPPKYHFKTINKTYPISCNYGLDISENGELLDDIKCKVKYDKKKNVWEIEILDYTSSFGIRESIYSYETLYKHTQYNKKVSSSAKDAITSAIAKAINGDCSLKEKLLKGKHTIGCTVYNHWIRYNRTFYYLQPFVDNIVIQ